MVELYLISRLGIILMIFIIGCIISGMCSIVTISNYYGDNNNYINVCRSLEEDSNYIEKLKSNLKFLKKLAMTSCIVFAICLLGIIVTPSTKEAYIICTIDYLKQNKDAKQIPDKYVKALNCFLDREINDSTKVNNEHKQPFK